MKIKLYTLIILLLLFVNNNKSIAQNANTSLSNLTAPTKVNVNLVPNKNNVRDLGAANKSWRNIYFTGSQYTGTYRVIAIDTVNASTFIGMYAGIQNTTGSGNVGLGYSALSSNVSGFNNIAIGSFALKVNNETGNIAIGFKSLNGTTASQYNTAVGYGAGALYDNGYNNVFIGADAQANDNGYYNDIAIGKSTICLAPSQARIGNNFTTSIGGYADWSNISDGRVKKNIKQNVPGLIFINKLQPITYNLDLTAADNIIQKPRAKDKDEKIIQLTPDELHSKKIKEQIVYTGFIAQDVEKAAKSLNYDFSGVDPAKNDKDLYGLRYAEFVVPLVKAVQELSQQNDSLNLKMSEFENLKTKNREREQRIARLEAMMNTHQSTANLSSASLQQNIPNPFNHTTTIIYNLPNKFSSAKIMVADKSGKVLKALNILQTGKASLTLDAATLANGAYTYSLYVDGNVVDTKQMEHIR